MHKRQDRIADRQELKARIKELEDATLLLRAECAYLKKRRSRTSDGVGGGRKKWTSEVIAVRDLAAEYGLKVMLAVSGMRRSTYFYRPSHLEMSDTELRLRRETVAIFRENGGYYGHRKITSVLGRHGIKVNKKRSSESCGRRG